MREKAAYLIKRLGGALALGVAWAFAETLLVRYFLEAGRFMARSWASAFFGRVVFYGVLASVLWFVMTLAVAVWLRARKRAASLPTVTAAGLAGVAVFAAAALVGYFVGYRIYKGTGVSFTWALPIIGGVWAAALAACAASAAAFASWARRHAGARRALRGLGYAAVVIAFAGTALARGVDWYRGSKRPRPAGRPDVVLVTIDAFRADAFNARVTPNLRAYAGARGTVFTRARAAATWTLPSFTAMFTGVFDAADVKGFERPGRRLKTWAEVMWENGYDTYAVIKNPYVDSDLALLRGFGYYYQADTNVFLRAIHYYDTVWYHGAIWEHAGARAPGASSRELTAKTLAVLTRKTSRPKFVWVHYLDPHYPYVPSADALRAVAPGFTAREYADASSRGLVAANAPALRVLYEAEARTTDDAAASLFRVLQGRPDALVIVTADHGEEFGEHGHVSHGWSVYDDNARVPLIVSVPPEGRFADGDVAIPVSLVDLAPSVISHLGFAAPHTMEGRKDLLAAGGPRGDAPVYMAMPGHDAFWAAVVRGTKKVVAKSGAKGVVYEYYDLAADPGERKPVAWDAEGVRLKSLVARKFAAEFKNAGGPAGPALPPGRRQELKALGYD